MEALADRLSAKAAGALHRLFREIGGGLDSRDFMHREAWLCVSPDLEQVARGRVGVWEQVCVDSRIPEGTFYMRIVRAPSVLAESPVVEVRGWESP